MKIQIEYWKEEKKLSKKVNNLLNESIICYKHDAYRASLLFSYLAFVTIIKETIIRANKPATITQTRWDSILTELQNDDKWEKRVFDELTNSSSPIFNIKEDLRLQIKFWKDRRNDCAHFKDNEVEYQHVESFWSFLRSNLIKINVEGGRQNLLVKFQDHFDTTKTPPNSDLSPLVSEIENAVESNEVKDFLTDLRNILDPYGWNNPNYYKIINKSFELCHELITEKVVEFILENNFEIEFISNFPDKVNYFNFSATQTRELWKKKILLSNNNRYIFDLYAALIRNNLIPQAELSEAYSALFDYYEQTRDSFPSNTEILLTLKNDKLGDIIFKKAIEEDKLNNFMWVNSKTDFIAFYFEHFTLKKESVETLFAMLEKQNYSWWLRDSVLRILNSNSTKKSELHNVATQSGLTVPNVFE